MQTLLIELKHALRSIAAQPSFSALVIGVLGVGLASVLYTLVMIDGVYWRPLPFTDAERLYQIGIAVPDQARDSLDGFSDADLVELQRRLDGKADLAGFYTGTINLSDLDRPERYDGAFVSANLLRVLGMAPLLGRDFAAGDDRAGAAATVMLSYALWKNRYAGAADIIGRQVRVNARPATVIGVMPETFSFPIREAIWVPAALREDMPRGGQTDYDAVAGLAPGVEPGTIQPLLDGWLADAAHKEPEAFHNAHVASRPLSNYFTDGPTRAIFGSIFIAVLMLLLLACANVANLLLTRTLARRQELAVRVALGADRGRLAVHLLAQSLLLSLLACALAWPLVQLGVAATLASFDGTGEGPPQWMRFNLDWRFALAAAVCAGFTAVAVGVLPALRAGGAADKGALRDSTRNVGGRTFARLSRALVVGEIALSCALLISAGMLVRGITALDHSDLGVSDAKSLLTARVALFESSYPKGVAQANFFERVTTRLRDEADVIDGTAGTAMPGFYSPTRELLPAGDAAGDAPLPRVQFGAIDAHWLDTFGIRLREGRGFDERDRADAPSVAIVDAKFAERFGNGGSVLGRRFRLDPRDPASPTFNVIGVTAPVLLDAPNNTPRPAVLMPLLQQPGRFAYLAVRTHAAPAAFAGRLADDVRAVDADTPAYWVRTYDEILRNAAFGSRVVARLFLIFGVIGLLLAAAGLYGVIAYAVGQQTREIGVRRALGASARAILARVLARSGAQVVLGVGIGLALGLPLALQLASALGRFNALDPLVLAGVPLLLLFTALVAVLVPARRALGVDPMVALRHD
ncbi:MAG: ADOP family duplicated permease [Dokdonella sp.]